MSALPKDGDTFVVRYPFIKEAKIWTSGAEWRPGTKYVECGPEDSEAIAHGEGIMTLDVISVHKPGKYQTRVFFVRRFRTPDGEFFGRPILRMASIAKFRRISDHYGVDYSLREYDPEAHA